MDRELDKFGDSLSKIPLKSQPFTQKKEVGELLRNRIEIRKKREKRRKRIIRWSISLTAAVLISGVVSVWKLSEHTYEMTSKHVAFHLPDGSHVTLGENSEITYNSFLWHFSRSLSLSGNAKFEVTTGSKFTVNTIAGNISVLGTKFYVSQKYYSLNVACFEGSVKVETPCGTTILMPGEYAFCEPGSELKKKKIEEEKIEADVPKLHTYDNTNLNEVVNEIETIYDVVITPKDICKGYTFTGAIPTNNLNVALEIVFGSCNINYNLSEKQITISR